MSQRKRTRDVTKSDGWNSEVSCNNVNTLNGGTKRGRKIETSFKILYSYYYSSHSHDEVATTLNTRSRRNTQYLTTNPDSLCFSFIHFINCLQNSRLLVNTIFEHTFSFIHSICTTPHLWVGEITKKEKIKILPLLLFFRKSLFR